MPEFKITQKDHNAGFVVGENLVASIVPEVRQEIKRLINEGVTTLVVDVAQVGLVDSTGIGCLVAAHNSLIQIGGCLEVVNASSDVLELFTSMRLDRHFSIKGAANGAN